jgi:hypothetical protein
MLCVERAEVIRHRGAVTKVAAAWRRRGGNRRGTHDTQDDQFSKLHMFS